MNFNEAIQIIERVLSNIGIQITENNYDGIIVKRLEASNTLDQGRTTNQTHIAITGGQMDIFPYLRAEGYFSVDYSNQDSDLKKYFVTQIPVWLYKSNIEYLESDELALDSIFTASEMDNSKKVLTTVVRSRRRNQTDQIQMSLINIDSPEFVAFRKMLHSGSYLIILKRKEKLEYEFYGVVPNRGIDGDGGLGELNNQFYKLSTQTRIDISEIQYSSHERDRVKGGNNILLYGVPGSGKSHTIKQEYCNDPTRMERVVFHPDYTYSDFVGQILPDIADDGRITYKFTPGPFTKILLKSYKNPSEKFYLIVEEINRGNAPAIFGEVFQLLDRDLDGNSEYSISNSDVARIIYDDSTKLVTIPSNLSILATMNTSDQNVFTLDTAFQRRWRMRMIQNNVNEAEHANYEILDTRVKWKVFNHVINNQILENSVGISSAEDKRLGAYFVRPEDLRFDESEDDAELDEKSRNEAASNNSRFPEKVIKYLWDDAFKFSRSSIFVDQYRSLEELVQKFNKSRGIERFSIFNPDIVEQFTIQE